jgi:hypothetical protein
VRKQEKYHDESRHFLGSYRCDSTGDGNCLGLFSVGVIMYQVHAENPIGSFVEKEFGHPFEYSTNDVHPWESYEFPHKVWVGDGYRYAHVLKTVAYVVSDEDENGKPVLVRWYIKNHREYTVA